MLYSFSKQSYWLWLLIYCNIWSTRANFIIFSSSREFKHLLTYSCSDFCLLFDSSLIMQNQHSVMWKGMWSLSWLTFPLGCSFDIEQCGGFSSSPASVLMRQLNPWCCCAEGWERGRKGSVLGPERPLNSNRMQKQSYAGCLKDPSHVFIVLQLNLARDFNPSSGLCFPFLVKCLGFLPC